MFWSWTLPEGVRAEVVYSSDRKFCEKTGTTKKRKCPGFKPTWEHTISKTKEINYRSQ